VNGLGGLMTIRMQVSRAMLEAEAPSGPVVGGGAFELGLHVHLGSPARVPPLPGERFCRGVDQGGRSRRVRAIVISTGGRLVRLDGGLCLGVAIARCPRTV